ncbi:hypothetical protein AQJ23_45180 [Streptomyces antibioticus]|nr:hypothetical protein [Streptomyces antibioticus]KUN16472.1 hypothetical protein AQJ23_45180 [Streptomyces antibioticus]
MTNTETDVQRYDRLSTEFRSLRRVHPDERTDEQRERMRDVARELTELLSLPPAGYSLPKAAADLMAYAKAHGWSTEALWTALGYGGEPFVNVRVGRLLTGEERDGHRGDRWVYELTWHSRDCAPGKVRRFGQGTAVTPDEPATRGCPSLKAIRAIIAANPRDVTKAA